ncbi:MAG: hypothetical protein JXR41_10470, partial [Bacteroidales bacterium]|nr:hypothetical protein [Bacteroidales bacterium]
MKKAMIFFMFAIYVMGANSQQMQFDWIARAGGPGWDIVTDMAEMPGGNMAVSGAFYDSIFFSSDTLVSRGSRDVFLAIYKADGTPAKAVSFGGEGYDYV